MLIEFAAEQAGTPYLPKNLSPVGLAAFPQLMRDAMERGSAETLADGLANDDYWNTHETYLREGVVRDRKINVRQASERLAVGEFLAWYTRALSSRLIAEGVEACEVYRAADPKWAPGECAEHEGAILDPGDVYEGHRARYWPEPGRDDVVSVPFGPGCHHTIRRVS